MSRALDNTEKLNSCVPEIIGGHCLLCPRSGEVTGTRVSDVR